jgi:hypothetical protein
VGYAKALIMEMSDSLGNKSLGLTERLALHSHFLFGGLVFFFFFFFQYWGLNSGSQACHGDALPLELCP